MEEYHRIQPPLSALHNLSTPTETRTQPTISASKCIARFISLFDPLSLPFLSPLPSSISVVLFYNALLWQLYSPSLPPLSLKESHVCLQAGRIVILCSRRGVHTYVVAPMERIVATQVQRIKLRFTHYFPSRVPRAQPPQPASR